MAGAGEDKDINLSQAGVEAAKIGLGIDSSEGMSSSNIPREVIDEGACLPLCPVCEA